MSLEHKCDRCGVYYSDISHEYNSDNYQVVVPMNSLSFHTRKDLCIECTKKLNRFMAGEDLASTVGNNPIYYVEPKPSVIERFKNKFRKKDKNERNVHHRGCPYSV